MTPTSLRAHIVTRLKAITVAGRAANGHGGLTHLDQAELPDGGPERGFVLAWVGPMPRRPEEGLRMCSERMAHLRLSVPYSGAGDALIDRMAEDALLVNDELDGLSTTHAEIHTVSYDGGEPDYEEGRVDWQIDILYSQD